MEMGSINWIVVGATALAVGVLAFIIGMWAQRRGDRVRLEDAESRSVQILEEARRETQLLKKTAAIESREEWFRAKAKFDEEIWNAKQEVERKEQAVVEKQGALKRKGDQLQGREKEMQRLEKKLDTGSRDLEAREGKLEEILTEQNKKLEQISGLTAEAARDELLKNLEDDARAQAAIGARRIREEAERSAERQAQRIISIAIQRLAAEQSVESTVTVVTLPSEEMKGRIIGREGRNIRAFESTTGVDVVIDDTPEAVLLSGYDPVRREVARQALEKLITDGRIHPGRIEEVVERARREVEREIRETGERVALDMGVHGLHADLVRNLGSLKYRTSFGQNVLMHSMEVASLAAMMGAELGVNTALAVRSGLLHDIGKAVDHEVEGPHAIIGMELARRCNEREEVCRAIGAHHGEIECDSVVAALVQAADAISGARPGARRETLEAYVKRLEKLESLVKAFAGVDKCFAIQAGREIRIMVQQKQVNDDEAAELASAVAIKIEKELQYPGQIKVLVIRETRAVEYAR